jgi:hypothetical protein
MRVLRWVGGALGAVLLLLVAAAGVARLSDGPIGIFPGGPLEAGELVTGPEPDWDFARDIPEMEFQLAQPPRSRTVWLLVHDHRLYIVSGYMDTAIGRWWKQWPPEAEQDGRALIRIDGRRYERQAVRLHDRPLIEALAAEAHRKYGVGVTADAADSGAAWFFALEPRKRPGRGAGQPSAEPGP